MSLVCARVCLVCLGWWGFIGGQFSEVTQHHRSQLAFHIKQNSLDIFNGESLSKLSISPYIIIYDQHLIKIKSLSQTFHSPFITELHSQQCWIWRLYRYRYREKYRKFRNCDNDNHNNDNHIGLPIPIPINHGMCDNDN